MKKTFIDFDKLNKKEQAVYLLFEEMDSDTLISYAIQRMMADPTVIKFRSMICTLKSQNEDNPKVMQAILGDAYNPVMAL